MANVFTLTGASGSGKSTVVDCLLALACNQFRPEVVPKFTTRAPRTEDERETICVQEIPAECDLVYEQYQVRYGLNSGKLFELVRDGRSPIVILNDVRTVEDVKAALGRTVRSVFVFREGPSLERLTELAAARGVRDQKDIERRFRKAQAIYRIYIENIYLFDHVILNSGTRGDLRLQVRQLVRGVRERNWPLRDKRR